MKLLIAGSRKITSPEILEYGIGLIIARYGRPSEILHGGALGVDELASRWANQNNIPQTIIRPDYGSHYPTAAPLIRNTQLVELADITLAIYYDREWRTGGTWDTAQKTIGANKKLLEMNADKVEWAPRTQQLKLF